MPALPAGPVFDVSIPAMPVALSATQAATPQLDRNDTDGNSAGNMNNHCKDSGNLTWISVNDSPCIDLICPLPGMSSAADYSAY
jgi:hypothetical protein